MGFVNKYNFVQSYRRSYNIETKRYSQIRTFFSKNGLGNVSAWDTDSINSIKDIDLSTTNTFRNDVCPNPNHLNKTNKTNKTHVTPNVTNVTNDYGMDAVIEHIVDDDNIFNNDFDEKKTLTDD